MTLKGIFRDKVKNFAALLVFIPVIRILNFKDDILESYKYISPDGLDWIIQGRIFGTDGVVIPVLRNPGYVFVSKIDWLLGAHGFSFAIASFLGLFLQFFVLIETMKSHGINTRMQYVGVLLYYLTFVHFIALYILPDGIAVGLICFGLHICFRGLHTNQPSKWHIGLVASIAATTFQIYAFSIFICLMLGIFFSDVSSKIKIRRYVDVTVATLISLLIIRAWRDWNTHLTVPSQISLLKNSFDMFPFYGHTLTLAFLPLFIVSILAVCLQKVKFNLSIFQKLSILIGIFLITLALFYQWPESRFIYTGVGLIYISVLPVVLKTIDSNMNPKKNRLIVVRASRLTLVATALLLFSFGPANPWQPRLDQLEMGRTWPIEVLYDYSNNTKSSYRSVIKELKDDCFNNDSMTEKSVTIAKYTLSEYQVSQLDLFAAYCLFK